MTQFEQNVASELPLATATTIANTDYFYLAQQATNAT